MCHNFSVKVGVLIVIACVFESLKLVFLQVKRLMLFSIICTAPNFLVVIKRHNLEGRPAAYYGKKHWPTLVYSSNMLFEAVGIGAWSFAEIRGLKHPKNSQGQVRNAKTAT